MSAIFGPFSVSIQPKMGPNGFAHLRAQASVPSHGKVAATDSLVELPVFVRHQGLVSARGSKRNDWLLRLATFLHF